MKEHTTYECEFCNTTYNSMEKALQCEENHRKPKTIVSYKYKSKKTQPYGIPVEITIEMENGEKAVYRHW